MKKKPCAVCTTPFAPLRRGLCGPCYYRRQATGKLCVCGCGQAVNEPRARYASKSCYRHHRPGFQRMKSHTVVALPAADRVLHRTCRACRGPLTRSEQANKIRRCVQCRQKSHGQTGRGAVKHKPTLAQRITVTNRKQLTGDGEARSSFWLNATRENFTQTCAAQPFRWVDGMILKPWIRDE